MFSVRCLSASQVNRYWQSNPGGYIRSRKRLVCSFTLDTLSILLLMFGHQLVTQFLSLMMTFYIKFGSEWHNIWDFVLCTYFRSTVTLQGMIKKFLGEVLSCWNSDCFWDAQWSWLIYKLLQSCHCCTDSLFQLQQLLLSVQNSKILIFYMSLTITLWKNIY